MALFQIDQVLFVGGDPPPDMFAYARTILGGRVIEGTLRVGDCLRVLMEDGTSREVRISGLGNIRAVFAEISPGGPAEVMFLGHLEGIRVPGRAETGALEDAG